MFTGLIESLGTLREIRKGGNTCRVTIGSSLPAGELTLGESISVNGICLTVVDFAPGFFKADVSPETLQRSTLGALTPGTRVNLERALRLGDRLGGHIVTGHIDGMGQIARRYKAGNAFIFEIEAGPQVLDLLVPKGSIAVDGISLTVNEVSAQGFSLAIIPHSLEMTNLQFLELRDQVNLELDILGKYVAKLLDKTPGQSPQTRINLEFLAKNGYL